MGELESDDEIRNKKGGRKKGKRMGVQSEQKQRMRKRERKEGEKGPNSRNGRERWHEGNENKRVQVIKARDE